MRFLLHRKRLYSIEENNNLICIKFCSETTVVTSVGTSNQCWDRFTVVIVIQGDKIPNRLTPARSHCKFDDMATIMLCTDDFVA